MDQPERVRYFDQQFLRVEDFMAEQDYHRDMRRRHNRMLHTPGISEGLLLSADGTGVKISPGAAIAPGTDENGGGAEIVFTAGDRKELSSFAANAPVFVTIAFDDQPSRERDDAGVKGHTRWREVPEIELFTSDPTTNPPADPDQRLRLLLGRVVRGGAAGKEVVSIDNSDRRIAGSAESELSLTPRDPAVQEPDWVRLRWLARGQAELRGTLKLIAGQAAPGDLAVTGSATVGGQLTVNSAVRGGTLESSAAVRGRSLRIDTTAADTPSTDIAPAAITFHRAGTASNVDPRISSDAPAQLSLTAQTVNAIGVLNVGQRAARSRLNVYGDAVVERALIAMGRTDGSNATAGEVLGGLGFLGHGVQHGQLSFRAGAGFELVDRSADGPSLDYPAGSRPHVDLRARNIYAVGGALRPSAGNAPTAGIQFPSDPGGGAGDEAFVRYYAEAGEATKLMIGVGNDLDDRIGFWQAGAERMTIFNGCVGVGTAAPSARLHVIGDLKISSHAIVGAGANGALTVRHVNGKRADGDAPDTLYLNWDNGQAVFVGGGAGSALSVQGDITLATQGTLRSPGRLHAYAPERLYLLAGDAVHITNDWGGPGALYLTGSIYCAGRGPGDRPQGHGEGIITWDVEAKGGVYSPVKKFVIDHPLDPDRRLLVHACVEGPEHGVYYRGEGQLTGGRARVELPDFFEALTQLDGRTVSVTPQLGPDGRFSAIAASAVENGAFDVQVESGGDPSQRFWWHVHAVRADLAPLEIEEPKLTAAAPART